MSKYSIKLFSMAIAAATAFSVATFSHSADAKNFTLRIGSGQPMMPLEPIFMADKYFAPTVAERVAAETEHKVKFIKLWNTVSGPFDVLEAVQKGLMDIGLFCACFEPTKAEQMAFHFYVPFVTDDSMLQHKITRQLYKEFPEWPGALAKYGQRWLGASTYSTYGLGTTFPWSKMEDLRGRKIGGAGLNLPWLKLSGATVVQTSLNEAYNAIQSGVYEGFVIFPPAWVGFKLHEQAKHYTVVGWGATSLYQMTMNEDTYQKLPASIQKIINEEKENWMVKATEEAVSRFGKSIDTMKKSGSTVKVLPRSERRVMAQALDAWSNEKAKKFDSQGLPGSKLFRRYMELAEQNGIDLPHKYNIK